MNRILIIGTLIATLTNAISALAMSQMDRANALYQQRSQLSNIKTAKEIYSKVIKDTHADLGMRREALIKYGRLASFQGALARQSFGLSEKEAAKVFKECLEHTEYLSPKKIGKQTAEYTYWRATCIGLWAANAGVGKIAFHLGRISELKELAELGQQKFKDYDGYGFNRIQAGMAYKSKALKDLYNPQRALKLINEIIEHGTDIYITYFLKAEILQHLGNTSEAIHTLDNAIHELNDRLCRNDIPADLVLENTIFLSNMTTLREELTRG